MTSTGVCTLECPDVHVTMNSSDVTLVVMSIQKNVTTSDTVYRSFIYHALVVSYLNFTSIKGLFFSFISYSLLNVCLSFLDSQIAVFL